MPRGFLVKRNKNQPTMVSHRSRLLDWQDDRQAGRAAIEDGLVIRCSHARAVVDSPDSGYGNSPVSTADDRVQVPAFGFGKDARFSTLYAGYNDSVNTPTYQIPSSHETSKKIELGDHEGTFSMICKTPTTPKVESTPTRCLPLKKRPFSADQWTMAIPKPLQSSKKPRAVRKLNFDNDDKSPVLGTVIQESSDTRHKIQATEQSTTDCGKGKGGLFVCKLCKEDYDNTLSLAQHKCSRIINVEYRCPECDKVFNCHANLASHRRWHKPRPSSECGSPTTVLPVQAFDSLITTVQRDDLSEGSDSTSHRSTTSPELVTRTKRTCTLHTCEHCRKSFRRPVNLRKHLQHRHGEAEVWPCQYCGQTFGSMKRKSTHICRNLQGDNL